LLREQKPKSPFIFVSERGAPFSKRGFAAIEQPQSLRETGLNQ
jgi:hypothetical protein